MTSNEPDRSRFGSWAGRVAYSLPDQVAYRPGEVLVGAGRTDAEVVRRAAGLLRDRFGSTAAPQPNDDEPALVVGYARLAGSFDVLAAVEVLRAAGLTAQPNNVLFAHCGCGGGSGCPPHPAAVWAWSRARGCGPPADNPYAGNPFSGNPFSGNPFSGNPFSGNPFSGNPFSGNPFSGNPFSGNSWGCGPVAPCGCAGGPTGNPFSGNPFSGNPFSGNPFSGNASGNPYGGTAWPAGIDPSTAGPWSGSFAATGHRRSSARPANDTSVDRDGVRADGAPVVYVVDSALPPTAARPRIIEHCETSGTDPALPVDGRADADGDGYLDPVSGHSAFGAGLVAQVAPGSRVHVVVAMSNLGDLDEFAVCTALERIAGSADFVNLSFGSYAATRMNQLAAAVRLIQTTPGPAAAAKPNAPADRRGAVVVASAGNDATCRPAYPAALPGVIAVGALAPDGSPAPFTNYGSWVRACAPGMDLVSAFFRGWDGREPATPGWGDPDRFEGGARWSGTSFAAPLVVGRLALEVQRTGCLPAEAVTRLIDDVDAPTVPGLGTVVS